MLKFQQKIFGSIAAIISLFLLIYYLFRSHEITTVGVILAIMILALVLVFIFGIVKNKLRVSLISSQLILGIIFIFSGFVKAVDPMGSMIKIIDYFIAFHLESLIPISLLGAFILSVYEFPLGVSILFGAKGKLMSWLLLIIMIPFTLLTLYLAIKNPVSDCGCFGDALILSNWETFFKNVIIMFFVVFLMMNKNKIEPLLKGWIGGWGIVGTSLIFILALSIYCKAYLPILDFRPYKIGNDIQQLMIIPDDKEGDVYETILLYKNKSTNQIKEFDIDNIPMDDQWEWIETKNKLIKKGYTPPIHDFKLTDSLGNDLTNDFLNQEGYKLLIVHDKLSRANIKGQKKLNDLVNHLVEANEVNIWAVTSSHVSEIEVFRSTNEVPYHMIHADLVTLETIIRSNPGVVLFKDNVILKKWPARKVPDIETFNSFLFK